MPENSKIMLDFSEKIYYNVLVTRLYGSGNDFFMFTRKVRASQSKVTANGSRGRP